MRRIIRNEMSCDKLSATNCPTTNCPGTITLGKSCNISDKGHQREEMRPIVKNWLYENFLHRSWYLQDIRLTVSEISVYILCTFVKYEFLILHLTTPFLTECNRNTSHAVQQFVKRQAQDALTEIWKKLFLIQDCTSECFCKRYLVSFLCPDNRQSPEIRFR